MKTLLLGTVAAMLTAGVAFAQTSTVAPSSTTPPPAVATPAPGVTNPPAGTMAPVAPRAQLSPSNNSSTTPPAVTTSQAPSKTAAAPVKGRNSFTLAEARRRITAGGFTQVTALRKDRDGIWRGTAMKDGASTAVYCDYQGNVGAQ